MAVTIEMIQERLREAISQSGYKQTELAKKLGITQATVSDYMHKNKFPALDTLANLCRILDVSPAYILCFEN
ncbi:MAG TPA: helix-turn-helix domain-containing protein [Firmicutes bacterium]|nr:helix-turn-helix domain-containing protein [Bacillota bacterium]